MMDARDRLERNVRVATTLVAAALLTTAGAAAEGGGAGLTLGGSLGSGGAEAKADGSGSAAAPAADQGPQPMPKADDSDPNPAHWEFAFVSVGVYQAWSVVGRWLLLGAGGGIGPPLYRYSELGGDPKKDERKAGWDPTLDIVYANLFVRIAPVPNVELDLGPKIAIISALYDVKEAPQSGFSYGGYADLRVGTPTVKVGPRFEYDQIAYHDYYDHGWRLTPLMLRVVH